MLSVFVLSYRYAECRYAECRYAECRYADCRGAFQKPFKNIRILGSML